MSPDIGTVIKIHCVTAQIQKKDEEQYHFTLVINSAKLPFYVSHFIDSLAESEYSTEIPELERKVDSGYWKTKKGA